MRERDTNLFIDYKIYYLNVGLRKCDNQKVYQNTHVYLHF